MQEYINNMIVQNPAAARRVMSLGRNFTEEPDWIPVTPAGGRYNFRMRPNYDLFPLNETSDGFTLDGRMVPRCEESTTSRLDRW